MGRSIEVYVWHEVGSHALFGQFWLKNIPGIVEVSKPDTQRMQYINAPPNLSTQLPHAAMWRAISFAHSRWCGDACSKICKGPPDRPNQNSLPLSLRVVSRKTMMMQWILSAMCLPYMCLLFWSSWLNIWHNPIKKTLKKTTPEGFWQSKFKYLFHKISQSFGIVMNHFLRNWIPYPMATTGICKCWYDVHLNLNIFGEGCNQTKSSTAHWDRNTWR